MNGPFLIDLATCSPHPILLLSYSYASDDVEQSFHPFACCFGFCALCTAYPKESQDDFLFQHLHHHQEGDQLGSSPYHELLDVDPSNEFDPLYQYGHFHGLCFQPDQLSHGKPTRPFDSRRKAAFTWQY